MYSFLLTDNRVALRIEWARTRALGLRNTEEVDLLEEEMRRTPVYLRWWADWWDSQKVHTGPKQRPDLLVDERQREGHDAYATRQARTLRTIASRFERKWTPVPATVAAGRAEVAVAEAAAAAETAAATVGRGRGARDTEEDDDNGDTGSASDAQPGDGTDSDSEETEGDD